MALRDALLKMEGGEAVDDYLARALALAEEVTAMRQPHYRVEVGEVFTFSTRPGSSSKTYAGASLWVDKAVGMGRSQSWQKVTGSIYADRYADVLAIFARALDRKYERGEEDACRCLHPVHGGSPCGNDESGNPCDRCRKEAH